jgi:outer membrane protein assembly factor BamB
MHDFEPHNVSDDDQSWNDEIQFLDLDPPDTSSRSGGLLRSISGQDVLRKTRWWMIGATVVGVLLLLVQTGYIASLLGNRSAKDVLRNQTIELPSSVLLATSQSIYTLDADGGLNALRASDGKLLWRYSSSLQISRSVQVINGIAYFIASDERHGDIAALRSTDGSLLWHYPLDSTVPTWFTVEKNVVYISAQNGMIYALNAANGRILWQYSGDPSSVSEPFVYLVDGILYTCSQSEKHFVALQADNGALLWKRDTTFAQVFLNAVAEVTYIGSGDGSVSAFRSLDGKALWRVASSSTQLSMSFSFAVSRDVAYLITQNGELDARRARDGALLWRFSPGYPIWGRLSLNEHTLYVGAYDGTIYALHDDGKLLWRYSTKQPVNLLSPTADQLFVQDNSVGDTIYVLRASDGGLLWSREMGKAAYFQSGAFLVMERVMYLTTVDGTVNALRKSDGRLLWSKRILRLPQLQDDILYVAAAEGGINALSAYTGATRWHATA